MEINFDAVVRLTEELLPLLRASAPSAIVNVASTAARVSRESTGAYSASKAALAAWSDALYLEEKGNGVHVGAVLPGFLVTEGFPQRHLTDRAATRWMAGKPSTGADAIADIALNRRPERYTPRIYGVVPALRHVAPGIVRKVLG
jgi:short-subunit dehydrogenase